MSAAGFTPIQLYRSTTASAVPTSGNLADGELAINTNDGKLYYKDSGGTVQLIASKAGASGDVVGPASATDNAVVRFDGTTGKLVQNSVVTIADSTGDIAGAGSITSTSASGILTRAAATQDGVELIGRAGGSSSYKVTLTPTTLGGNRTLTLPDTTGTVALTGSTVASFSAGSTGFTPNTATTGAVTLAGTLATTNGGTGLTSFTANGVVYASSSSALATGSALTFDGTTLVSGSSGTTTKLTLQGGTQTSMSIKSSTGTSGFLIGRGYASDDANTFFLYDLVTSQNRFYIDTTPNIFQYATAHVWNNAANSTEYMRLTSTGLGIGTSSPAYKLDVSGSIRSTNTVLATNQIISLRAGSDTAWSGPNLSVSNAGAGAAERVFALQLGASNTFDTWYYNGSSFVKYTTLDSSGNLGLGVTPSAWDSIIKALELNNGVYFGAQTDSEPALYTGTNNYYETGVFRYKVSSKAATRYQQDGGAHKWFNAPSGTAGNAISFTQAMTLDASGNLLVGGTSNSLNSRVLAENASGNQVGIRYTGIATYYLNATSGGDLGINKDGTERARITSGGDLLVGTTSSNGRLTVSGNAGGVNSVHVIQDTAGGYSFVSDAANNGGTYYHMRILQVSSQVGSITSSGSTTAYNTTSDQRLKTNIVDAPDAAALIDSIKVRSFDWKSDGAHQRYGFVAQELVIVTPEAVHQPADADEMMAVDYSKLVPMLVKEIQSLRQRVSQLEGA